MIARCQRVRILVTCAKQLQIPGEIIFSVKLLAIPCDNLMVIDAGCRRTTRPNSLWSA